MYLKALAKMNNPAKTDSGILVTPIINCPFLRANNPVLRLAEE